MYALLEEHYQELFPKIREGGLVTNYLWLRERMAVDDFDAVDDETFRLRYKNYWTFRGLNRRFLDSYFELLMQLKDNPELRNIDHVMNVLHAIPYNAKNYHSLHFSFGSKLLHMTRPSGPVYDEKVQKFYVAREPGKHADCVTFYNNLVAEYDRVTNNGLLANSIAAFRQEFDVDEEDYSDQKVIDTLIWQFVIWLEPGLLTNPVTPVYHS